MANNLKIEGTEASFDEECIAINTFHSSDELKNEIGSRIMSRRQMDWHFVSLCSKGAYIYLTFKQLKSQPKS